jgi:small GTP-binding protein
MIKQYIKGSFAKDYKMTIGTDIFTKDVITDEHTITLSIWDIAGQDRFKFFRQSFYRGASGAMVVFDLTRYPTFNPNVVNWLKELWGFTGRIPVVLIGNKVDLEDLRNVRQADVQEFADKIPCKYIETSAKTGTQVNEAFYELAQDMLNKMLTCPGP